MTPSHGRESRHSGRQSGILSLSLSLCLAAPFLIDCGASTPAVKTDDGSGLSWEIEGLLGEADVAVESGDTAKAKSLLARCGSLLDHPSLESNPDRHMLREEMKRIEARSREARPIVAGTVVAKAPDMGSSSTQDSAMESPVAQTGPGPSEEDRASPAPETPETFPDTNAGMNASSDDLLAEASSDELEDDSGSSLKDAAAAFRSGPVTHRARGIKLFGKAKSARSKKKRLEMYGKAESRLSACKEEGAALLERHPDLQSMRFKAGNKRLLAPKITATCETKLRKVKALLAKLGH